MILPLRRPAPATVIALLALFVALGGPAEARKLINGKSIKPGTISSRQVKNRGLSTRDLSRGAVRRLTATRARSIGTAQLAPGAVGSSQLQIGAVTADKLALNSVAGAAVLDGSLGTPDLAPDAVTTDRIATSGVTKADIAAGAVGASELASNVIDANEVVDGGLSAVDIAVAAGAATAAFGPIAEDSCQTITQPVAPLRPGTPLEQAVVLTGAPATWPQTLTLSGRPRDAASIDLTACNVGPAGVPAPAGPIRYVLIG